MDRIELLNKINAGRADLLAVLTRFTPEQMTTPDLPGEWSIKDLLAHLGWWQRRAVMIYHALKDGVRPETVLAAGTIDELNARVLADYRARDLDEVRAFELQAYLDLLTVAQTAFEDELFGHHTFSWTGGQPFVDWIAGETYEHYAEHLPALQALLAEQEGALKPLASPLEEEPVKPQENPVVARARGFLEDQGRFIDQTRLDYHFGALPLADLMEALSRYQSEDGGFHGLEVDIQAPQSNPFADELALVILRWADALPRTLPADDLPAADNLPAAEEPVMEELAEAEEPAAVENMTEEAKPETGPQPAEEAQPESGAPSEENNLPAADQPEVELPTNGAITPLVDNTVRSNPLFLALVGHLETAQQEDGTWRFSPQTDRSAMAPWFQEWQWPNLNPSLSIAGLLKQLGAGSDTLHARVQALFDQLANSADLTGGDFYAVRPYAYYFQTEWDLSQAEFYRQGVVWWLVRKLSSDPTFDATHFFEFAPTPDSAIAKRLPPALIAEQLDRLVSEQQEDGGWPTPYDARWRPWNTVNNLLVLRAYGKI